MPELDRKTLAKFRLLAAVARADDRLTDGELEALRGVLGPQVELLSGLLEEDIDVDAELAFLDEAERLAVYHSAFAVTYADGHASVEEVNMLKRIVPDKGEESFLGQVLGEAKDTFLPSSIVPVADPTQRDMEIMEDILKYSILAAVAGATPVPGLGIVADLAVIAIQAKMVRDIGQYWGHSMDMTSIRGFLGGVLGSTGVRVALNNLARFVPVWGSAFAATSSFATTYALGKVAQAYFAGGRELDEVELKGLFARAKAEGEHTYNQEKEHIHQVREAHGVEIAALNEQLAAGTIDRQAYRQAMAKMEIDR